MSKWNISLCTLSRGRRHQNRGISGITKKDWCPPKLFFKKFSLHCYKYQNAKRRIHSCSKSFLFPLIPSDRNAHVYHSLWKWLTVGGSWSLDEILRSLKIFLRLIFPSKRQALLTETRPFQNVHCPHYMEQNFMPLEVTWLWCNNEIRNHIAKNKNDEISKDISRGGFENKSHVEVWVSNVISNASKNVILQTRLRQRTSWEKEMRKS